MNVNGYIGIIILIGASTSNVIFGVLKLRYPEINFIHSTIDNLILKGNKYDLVFTSLVLIHQNPQLVNSVISKIVGISKKYIFGYEYFSDNLTEIEYRGHKNVLWKQNFVELFKKNHPSLKLVKEQKYHYLKNDLVDIAYLFEK